MFDALRYMSKGIPGYRPLPEQLQSEVHFQEKWYLLLQSKGHFPYSFNDPHVIGVATEQQGRGPRS